MISTIIHFCTNHLHAMKRFFSLLILPILLFSPQVAKAHIAGQPPFFLMNEKYADYYPVYSTSITNFTLPQDMAPENYLIDEPIAFKIDKDMLPFPPEVIEQITFSWDFGDGTTGEGTENSHTYTSPGSYLLKINADYGEYSDPNTKPVIQAVLLHVLPDKGYRLPKVVISVNGTAIEDPIIDTLSFPPNENLDFKASLIGGSSPIKDYYWDRGDGTSTTDPEFSYTYETDAPAYLFPFLRVSDENGFIVDTYVQIENSLTAEGTTTNESWIRENALFLLIGFNVVLLSGGGYFLFKKKRN